MDDAAPPGRPAPPARGRRDLTKGPIGRTLLAFALPVLAANALQSLNASVNAIWVSHVLGEQALAATANANILLMFLLGSIFGVSMAANLLVAQSVGANDVATVKRVVGASAAFFAVLSVAVAIAGYALTPVILGAMGTPPAARAEAVAYLRMIFFALPFMYFFNYVQMAQRGAGDARTPLYFSMLAVGLDIALNPLLIIGVGPFPKMGIEGSAAATLVAQATSLALLMAHLYRRRSILVLEREELSYLRPDPAILRTLIMRGLPMGLQMIVISSAAIAMISVVNRYGVDTAAGYAAASQLWTYVQMPAMAVAAAVSSMAAQNIGARRWDRVDQIARRGVPLGLIATATPVAIIYVFNRQFLHLFLPEGAALAIAQHINFHVMWGFVAFSVTFVLFGVVRANGAVVVPLAMLICSIWLLRVPLASIGSLYFGPDAIWWSFPTGTCFSAVLATLYYKFGGWRKARLMAETAGGEAADTGLSPPAIADEAIAENAEERPAAR